MPAPLFLIFNFNKKDIYLVLLYMIIYLKDLQFACISLSVCSLTFAAKLKTEVIMITLL